MTQTTSFVVSQFTNPSGDVVFRVSGWLHDARVRKNFKTRAEAEAERQSLEIQRLQAESGVRPALTRLTLNMDVRVPEALDEEFTSDMSNFTRSAWDNLVRENKRN